MTTRSPDEARRQRSEFHRRLMTRGGNSARTCAIPGCGRPPQGRAGQGVSPSHCKYHVQWKSRHGSFWKGTYSAADLKPYQAAAERFLKDNPADFWVAAAIKATDAAMAGAGPAQRVVDLKWRGPDSKAAAAFARLREAEIPPERVLRVCLAVSAAVAEDPIRGGGDGSEYRRVQMAKAVNRLASGQHSYYGDERYEAGYHRYPRSSGRFLRALGVRLATLCEHVVDAHLDAILAVKIERFGPRPLSPPPPFPKSRFDNARVPPGVASPDAWEGRQPGQEEIQEAAEALSRRLQADFEARGFDAFKGKF